MTKTSLSRFLISLSLIALSSACAHSTSKPEAAADSAKSAADIAFDKKFSGEPGDGIFPIIDSHTHNHFTGKPEMTSKLPDTQEEYLKEMKDLGVVGAIVHLDREGKDYRDLSQYNVLHCAGVTAIVDVPKLEAGLKSGMYRCMKIYLGYVHQWAYSPAYEPVYTLAEKYHVPVVFHTGDTYSTIAKLKYSDPLTIDEVAVDHPRVNFVIAHCGYPWIESAAEVAYKNPNVYLDASAFMIGDLSKYSAATIEEYLTKPARWIFHYVDDPNKMMYGTDWPLTGMRGYLEAIKKAIPREHWRKFFYENAEKIFGFPRK